MSPGGSIHWQLDKPALIKENGQLRKMIGEKDEEIKRLEGQLEKAKPIWSRIKRAVCTQDGLLGDVDISDVEDLTAIIFDFKRPGAISGKNG